MLTNTLSNKPISPVWRTHEGISVLVNTYINVPAEDLADIEETLELATPITQSSKVTADNLEAVLLLDGYTVRWDEFFGEYRASYWSVQNASGIKADKKRHVEHHLNAPGLPIALMLCEYHKAHGNWPDTIHIVGHAPDAQYKLCYDWNSDDYVPVH